MTSASDRMHTNGRNENLLKSLAGNDEILKLF